MKPHQECGACLVHWVFERAAPYIPEERAIELVRHIVKILLRDVSPESNVGLICNNTVHAAFDTTPGLSLYYEDLKQKSNENAKKVLPEAIEYINKERSMEGRLARACLLAAAANVAPLNAPSSPYTFKEISEFIFHDNLRGAIIGNLIEAVKSSNSVLYVTDNAGEIGFDSLVMHLIKEIGAKITLVVKKQTFFEDATMDDAHNFNLEELVDDIVTVPGFMVPDGIDSNTKKYFYSSDLIIAKGTGSYEALHEEIPQKKAVFMLKVKCRPIARELGMGEGNIIVNVE